MYRNWGVLCPAQVAFFRIIVGLLFGEVAWVKANPLGGEVAAGQAEISAVGAAMHIHQTSDRAVINWKNFSIQPGEMTQFHLPSVSSAVLNRVTSTTPSQLMGQLQANGQVYLMNPNGIFFGPGAVINASSFLAATADLAPSEFMAGRLGSLVASDTGVIRNEGAIRGEQGSVQLISKTIENTGTLEAPKGEVGLYAGRKFYLKPDGGGPIKVQVSLDSEGWVRNGTGIDQQGIIRAAQARLEANGNIYSLAIQQGGLMEATGFATRPDGVLVLSAPGGTIHQAGALVSRDAGDRGGEIVLRAERVETDLASMQTAAGAAAGGEILVEAGETALLQGQLEVSSLAGRGGRLVVTGRRVGFLKGNIEASGALGGGEVLLGGDYLGANPSIRGAEATVVGAEARILAEATGQGDGGKIILWSEDYTGFYGELFARGGPRGGDGGFIETSSKENLQAYGFASASAISGLAGKWLLDPRNVSIQTGGTGTLTGGVFTPSADSATIAPATITTALNGGTSVEINTGTTGSQPGDITVANAVSSSAGAASASLTLKAANNIIVNDVLNLSTMAGAGNISLLADADASGGGTVTLNAAVTSGTTGTVTLQGAGRIQVGATLTAKNVVFQPSTLAASMAVVDPIGTVQVLLSDLQAITASGTVTVGRASSTGTIRIGGTATVDLSGESYGLNILTASGGQTRLNGNIMTGGKAITFDSAVILTGDRTLKTDQGDTLGAAITMNKALDSDGLSGPSGAFWDLSLMAGTTGDVTFAQAVGVGARLGNITVGPANTLNVRGALRAESLATANLVTLRGNVNLDGSLDFSDHGIASTTVGLNLIAVGKIILNAGADVTSGGAITLQGGGGIETGADFLAVDSSITFRSPVALTGPVALTVQGASAGGGLPPEIRFESTLDSASLGLTPNLTLNAGSFGDVVLVGGAGQTISLGAVQVVLANNLTVAAMQAQSFQQSAGYGQTTFNGPQNYSADNDLSLGLGVTTQGNIAVAAASITIGNNGTVTLNAGQRIDIGSGGDISAGGAVSLTAGSGITTGGDILTSGDAVQIKSPLLLASDVTIDTRSGSTVGNVTFSSTVDGPYHLQVFAGQVPNKVAVVTFTGNVGALNALTELDVKAESIALNASTYKIDEVSGGSQTSSFDGSVVLGSDIAFDLEALGGKNNLSFLGTVNSDGTARSLQIAAGALRFDGAVGALASLKNFFVLSGGPWSSTDVIRVSAATIRINSAIEATATSVGLSLAASGEVNLAGNIGSAAIRLASVSINGSQVRFGGTGIFTVGTLTLGNGINTTPDVEGPGGNLNLNATTGAIAVSGLIDTRGKEGAAQYNGGNVTIATGNNINVASIITSAGVGKDAGLISIDCGSGKTITLNGTLTATGGRNGSAIIFNDDVSLGGATSILTSGGTGTSGEITFEETLGGAQGITLNSGSADITFSKAVSVSSLTATRAGSVEINGAVAVTGAGTVALTADTINLNAALSSVSGTIGMTADTINLNAALSSVSGNITLKPFTSGLGMSISDSSALGLVLTQAEVLRIGTSGVVTFGGGATGTIEFAGAAGTTLGNNTQFVSGTGLNLNGNADGSGRFVGVDSPILNVTVDSNLRAEVFQWSGTTMNGVNRTLTLGVPEVGLSASLGSDILLRPNLVFSRDTTLSADGLNPVFSGSVGSLTGVEKLVVSSGELGNLSFLAPVGQGARAFGNLLVQGNRILLGPNGFLRAGIVTVDAGAFLNQAGSGALSATSGRVLLFSSNPNQNNPTSFNAGISGVNPIFNQRAQVELGLASGTYSVGNNLPGGSLAVYDASLAAVLAPSDILQFADQQAYLAAVPVTAFQLPTPNLGSRLIRISESVRTTKIRIREPYPSEGNEGSRQPISRKGKSVKTAQVGDPAWAKTKLCSAMAGTQSGGSYSQYSQGFNSANQ